MCVSLNRFEASSLRTRSRACSELSPPTIILSSMLLSFDKPGLIETTCRCAGITRSRSSKRRVHENALRANNSFRNCERSRVNRFCGRFSVASACVFSASNFAITDSMSAISLRSWFAFISRVSATNTNRSVAKPSSPRAVPQFVQNRRASSYGWLARLISIRIFRKQGPDHARHSPFRNRAAPQAKLRSRHQLAHLRSRLRMQRRSSARNIGDPRHQYLLNVSAVCVLKKYHRGIHVFRQLLAGNSHSTRILEGSKKQQLLLVQNRDARGPRIHFHHQRPAFPERASQCR